MNPLGVSTRARIASRVAFYAILLAGMWMTNRLLPQGTMYGEAPAVLSVPGPLIAVPISELPAGVLLPPSR